MLNLCMAADYVRLGICNSPSPGDFSQLVGQHPCSPQSSALPSVIHPLSYIILPSGILSAFPLRAGRQRVASSTLKSPSDKLANATTHEIHILARGTRAGKRQKARRRQRSGAKEGRGGKECVKSLVTGRVCESEQRGSF